MYQNVDGISPIQGEVGTGPGAGRGVVPYDTFLESHRLGISKSHRLPEAPVCGLVFLRNTWCF